MKIKEYLITRYGPLKNKAPFQLSKFNLFWGKNEEGKTLTIDALVKLLLGGNSKDFGYTDRVEENPQGYVIILNDKGKEVKLPEKGDLTKIVDLTPSECCNIFIVRNSDLSIAREISQEREFYTNVTERLTGIRTGKISKLKKNLLDIGKITEGDKLFRNIQGEKLKERIEKAKELVKEIESLSKKIKEKEFEQLEEKSVRQREEIERIEQEIRSFEDARKREKYEEGKKALDKLKEALEKLKNLEIYNQEDKESWKNSNEYIQMYEEEKKKSFEELHKNEKEFEEICEKLSEEERNFQVLNEKKKKLDDEIKTQLMTYEIKSGELAQKEGESKFFNLVGIISTIFFGISLLGIIFRPSLLFYILTGLFLIFAVISGIKKFNFVREKAWLAGVLERIKLALSKFGLDAGNIEKINLNIEKFDEEYYNKENKLQEIRRKKENLEEKTKELRDKTIPNIGNKIKDTQNEIDKIKTKSKEDSLEGYSKKFELKQEAEKSKKEQEIILNSHFGARSENLEEKVAYWNEEIDKLKDYEDKANGIKYSETAVSELKKKKQESEEKLKKMNEEMMPLQNEMKEIEREVNEIIREEYLYCNTSVDLEAIKEKLQEFIEENENNRDNVLKVKEIFEEIEKEEKEKVSGLFGKESPVSNYFNKITNCFYEEVTFNQETEKIEVKRSNNGMILGAEKLSGGTYDQLYFSIRVALGEKLLKGKQGFFIMDDPFIKADPDRLQRQIKMLKEISELGWQIIYFSAKGEIKDAFKDDIKQGNINYFELQDVFF